MNAGRSTTLTGSAPQVGADPAVTRAGSTTIVVPTVARPSLRALLERLAEQSTPVDAPVVLVDDRPPGARSGDPARLDDLPFGTTVLASGGRGPAAARNLGWRSARTPWVSFLDDDVLPVPDWYAELLTDLEGLGDDVAGSQGQVRVPLPDDRRPTDWERSTAGLEGAPWITADLSYRREALSFVGGFDERFPRAYREDVDLGLRVTATGRRIDWGRRQVLHPVRPADRWVTLRRQAGNLDDALMRRLHGRDWRSRAHAPRGRLRVHAATVAAAGLTAAGALTGRRRAATAAGLSWALLTAQFAAARLAPGPRDVDESLTMVATSVPIPFAAVAYAVRGRIAHRRATAWSGPPDLVLLDRDGTIVHDVPYNADPDAVQPVEGAREALDRLRRNGIRVGVVSNQSGVGRGLISPEDLARVDRRVDELLGPFDVWCECVHAPDAGCACRKPAPGLVTDACSRLGVDPRRTVVVGDIGGDVEAAHAAGAVGVLVPTPGTREEEVAAAPLVRGDLGAVVDDLLGGRW